MTGRRYLGFAGHLVVSDSCRFHITTEVGDYLVSTVGAYQQPGTAKGEWTEIGLNRLYETFVFRLSSERCGCGQCSARAVASWAEIDSQGYNTAAEAEAGHEAMCAKYERAEVTP